MVCLHIATTIPRAHVVWRDWPGHYKSWVMVYVLKNLPSVLCFPVPGLRSLLHCIMVGCSFPV